MTAHEYLSKYLELDKDIERWQRAIRKFLGVSDWIDSPLPITASYSGMPPTPSPQDRMAEIMSRKVDSDMRRVRTFEGYIEKAKVTQMQILAAIDSEGIAAYRQVLDLRYIQGKSIDETAEEIERSSVTTRKICNRALARVKVPEQVSQKDHE